VTKKDRRETEPERRVKLTCAVDLESRDVDWLWEGRVPLGMITMFASDPKLRTDVVAITAAAARLADCRLIVIDPVSAYLSGYEYTYIRREASRALRHRLRLISGLRAGMVRR
jgi:hypothetical protein